MPMHIFASVYVRYINIISIQTLIVEFWIVKTVYIQKLLLYSMSNSLSCSLTMPAMVTN